VCDADLEDQLTRTLGVDRLETILAAQGGLASYRILQQQSAHRATPTRPGSGGSWAREVA
jgi:hypothetical protein